ncbi:MAG: hypothetical protein ACXWL2_01095 [Candidatus Chromulinivorax sp.]
MNFNKFLMICMALIQFHLEYLYCSYNVLSMTNYRIFSLRPPLWCCFLQEGYEPIPNTESSDVTFEKCIDCLSGEKAVKKFIQDKGYSLEREEIYRRNLSTQNIKFQAQLENCSSGLKSVGICCCIAKNYPNSAICFTSSLIIDAKVASLKYDIENDHIDALRKIETQRN